MLKKIYFIDWHWQRFLSSLRRYHSLDFFPRPIIYYFVFFSTNESVHWIWLVLSAKFRLFTGQLSHYLYGRCFSKEFTVRVKIAPILCFSSKFIIALLLPFLFAIIAIHPPIIVSIKGYIENLPHAEKVDVEVYRKTKAQLNSKTPFSRSIFARAD